MPHKETRLRFRQLLDEKIGDRMSRAEIVEALDVSSQTLSRYLLDHWSSVDRLLLERFADLVGCDIGDLFETRQSPFWQTFPRPSSVCNYVRLVDAPAAEIENTRRVVSDDKALRIVHGLITECAPHTNVIERFGAVGKVFDELLRDNLVVVGGPRSNPATERALAKIFGTQNPPFQFVWHPGMKAPLGAFAILAGNPGGPFGIKLGGETSIIEARYIHNKIDFEKDTTRDGRDCAVVVVANRTSELDGKPRKLMILAGFSGVGTEGAAKRLAADFREMEPRDGETHVWGIVEVIYTKTGTKGVKKLRHSDWRYRSGGRQPIAFKKNRINMQGGVRPMPKKTILTE